MLSSQVERLRKDSREFDHYIQNLKKKGNDSKVYKLKRKQEFLNQTILDQVGNI